MISPCDTIGYASKAIVPVTYNNDSIETTYIFYNLDYFPDCHQFNVAIQILEL